jgi:hypothetical protein
VNIKQIVADELDKVAPYPVWCCFDCAQAQLAREGRLMPSVLCTMHEGECGVCHEVKIVTEPRDFGYPRWKGYTNG